MGKQYEKRNEAFEEWLEEEHPCHSHWDHDTQGQYKAWLNDLRTAFNAGWAGRKVAEAQTPTLPPTTQGRGHVESILGDLKSLEVLNQAIKSHTIERKKEKKGGAK